MGRHRLSRKMADIEETAFQLTVDQGVFGLVHLVSCISRSYYHPKHDAQDFHGGACLQKESWHGVGSLVCQRSSD
jgi:hypothetical protein